MNFISRITKYQWANIVLLFCYVRMGGAAIYGILYHQDLGKIPPYIPLWYDPFYFVSSALYEVVALLAVLKLTGEHSWMKTQQFNFFLGFALFNLFEEVFFKPWQYDAAEYIGVIWALGFILIAYLWRKLKN